jgi:hypothetical protein
MGPLLSVIELLRHSLTLVFWKLSDKGSLIYSSTFFAFIEQGITSKSQYSVLYVLNGI